MSSKEGSTPKGFLPFHSLQVPGVNARFGDCWTSEMVDHKWHQFPKYRPAEHWKLWLIDLAIASFLRPDSKSEWLPRGILLSWSTNSTKMSLPTSLLALSFWRGCNFLKLYNNRDKELAVLFCHCGAFKNILKNSVLPRCLYWGTSQHSLDVLKMYIFLMCTLNSLSSMITRLKTFSSSGNECMPCTVCCLLLHYILTFVDLFFPTWEKNRYFWMFVFLPFWKIILE